MTTSSPIPAVRDDDPEDVSWALSTAATQWARGDRIEALKWLRRAAEAASEAEKDTRALELAKAAADLTTPSMPPPSASPPSVAPRSGPPPMPMPPPSRPAPSRPPPVVTPKAPTASPSSKIPPAPVSSRPAIPAPASSRPVPQPAKKKSADETSKRTAAAKPKPDVRPRPPSREDRTDTNIVTEVTRLDTKPPTHMTDSAPTEADGWPTESMKAGELESLQGEQVYGTERTRIGSPAYRPSEPPPGQNVAFRASQAVQVILWRDGDGNLRVAPRGTTVSAVTIEALLVAPSADVDLLAWLSPD